MTDQADFETRLGGRLRSRAAIAARPFDASAIAHRAAGTRVRSPRWSFVARATGRPFGGMRLTPIAVALLVLALAIGAVVVGSQVLRPDHRLVVGPGPDPTVAPSARPAASVVLSGTMLTPRTDHAAVVLRDGRVLVLGGLATSGGPVGFLASAEIWDPRTGSFSSTGSMSTERLDPTAILLPDGRVLVAGGDRTGVDGSREALASAEIWDPATASFTLTGSMGTARGVCHCGRPWRRWTRPISTLMRDGRVYIDGGQGQRQADVYDPAAGTFSQTSLAPCNVSHGAVAGLQDGRVLLACDVGVALYDPATDSFSAVDLRTGPIAGAATELPDGRILLSGAIAVPTDPASVAGDHPVLYDPTTGSMSRLDAVTDPGDLVLALADGRVLHLAIGQVGGDNPGDLAGSRIFDPATGRFADVAPRTEYGQTASLLADGRVLLVGGSDGLTSRPTVILDPTELR